MKFANILLAKQYLEEREEKLTDYETVVELRCKLCRTLLAKYIRSYAAKRLIFKQNCEHFYWWSYDSSCYTYLIRLGCGNKCPEGKNADPKVCKHHFDRAVTSIQTYNRYYVLCPRKKYQHLFNF